MGERGRADVVIGLSFDFHDAAAAVVVGGEVLAAAEEERFTRIKHDRSIPEQALRACLESSGLAATDIGHVVFYEKPLVVASRYLATRRRQGRRSLRPFVQDGPAVFGKNLAVGYRVGAMLQRLGCERPPPLQYVEHHLSHAASAYLASPFDEAAIVTADGIGEWATTSIAHGVAGRIDVLEELRYPDSIGLLYSFVTAYCGFRPNDDEYKVMGLAPYGTPRFLDAIRELADARTDGSIEVRGREVGWFGAGGLRSSRNAARFDGPPRQADEPIGQREADLAASIQAFTEQAMLALVERAHEVTGAAHLCLAGGVALNCVANGRIAREGPFDRLWVQPAAGDAGGAIGAALAHWHLELGHPRPRRGDAGRDAMRGAALGPLVPREEAIAELDAAGVAYRTEPDPVALADEVAARLAEGAVVGWVQGPMEFGPRALGHRSLLADPRDPTVRERLNRIVKGREDFRPFAPVVLAEHAEAWFELTEPSPYMLVVAPVLEDRRSDLVEEPPTIELRAQVVRSQIPACTHVDGSARVQTVASEDHPDLHRLLEAFHRRTGCPVLVNTSFNRAGDPIVCGAADAVAAARAGGIDLLVIGDVLIDGTALAP